MRRILHLFSLILLMVLSFSACRKAPGGEVVGQSKQECTPEEERIIGNKLKEVIHTNQIGFPLLDTTNFSSELVYLNRLLNTLTNTGPVLNRQNFNWNIQVITNDEEKNLFTAPGGSFFITTGLLKLISSETELLSILGHEIFYVDRNYVTNALINQFGGDKLGSILLGEAVPEEVSDMTNYLQNIAYDEYTVSQADSFAIELICPFLYDPLGMQHFLTRVRQSGDEVQVTWLDNRSTANVEDRIERVFRQARDCGDFGRQYEERYHDFQEKLPE
ncbi:MAG: M48 family metalloprotease [Bacteroidota bacterium]